MSVYMGGKTIIQYFQQQEEFFCTKNLVDKTYSYCHMQIQL